MSPKLTETIERREQLALLADDLVNSLNISAPGADPEQIKLAIANACLSRGLALLDEVNQVSRQAVLRGLVYRVLKFNPAVKDTAYLREQLWEKEAASSETPATST